MARKSQPEPKPVSVFDAAYIGPYAGSGYDWRCQRCTHQWRSIKPGAVKPRWCAGCHSASWDRQPKTVTQLTAYERKLIKTAKRDGITVPNPRMNARIDGMGPGSEDHVEATVASVGMGSGGISRAAHILPPPPTMQRAVYQAPVQEPAPENFIRKSVPTFMEEQKIELQLELSKEREEDQSYDNPSPSPSEENHPSTEAQTESDTQTP